MSEQLNNTNSEIVYYDFSKTSMSFTQFKVKQRGTGDRLVWVIDWIESIPRLGLGVFDFSVSTGVLHHLKCPQRGLNIVNDAQLADGGAEFMVYGKIGRASVYLMQELLRIVNQEEQNVSVEIKNAKPLLKSRPSYHWFQFHNINDLKTMGDAGIYDLLLHKRDVAFTMVDLYSWLEKAGYNFVDFAHAENAIPISLKNIVNDIYLLKKLTRMNKPLTHAIGEMICSSILKHDIYVSKKQESEASLKSNTSFVVFAQGYPVGFQNVMGDKRNFHILRNETFIDAFYSTRHQLNDTRDYKSLTREEEYKYSGHLIWKHTDFNKFVIETLTKKPIRPKTLSTLITGFNVVNKSNLTIEDGTRLFNDLFSYIKDFKIFFIKQKSIPSFPLTCCAKIYRVIPSYRNLHSNLIAQHVLS